MKIPELTMILALIEHGSVQATARALNIDESTIYKRMSDNAFRARLEAVKGDIMREYKAQYMASANTAKGVIESIMIDESVNPSVRLQSAQTIINTALKFCELVDRAEDRALRAKEYEREHRKDEENDFIDDLFKIG